MLPSISNTSLYIPAYIPNFLKINHNRIHTGSCLTNEHRPNTGATHTRPVLLSYKPMIRSPIQTFRPTPHACRRLYSSQIRIHPERCRRSIQATSYLTIHTRISKPLFMRTLPVYNGERIQPGARRIHLCKGTEVLDDRYVPVRSL